MYHSMQCVCIYIYIYMVPPSSNIHPKSCQKGRFFGGCTIYLYVYKYMSIYKYVYIYIYLFIYLDVYILSRFETYALVTLVVPQNLDGQ